MKPKNASDLIKVACDLQELYDLISLMQEDDKIKDVLELQVKGKDERPVLLPTLKRCHKIIDEIDSDGKIFVPIHDEMNECIDYLDKNYSIKSKVWKLPEILREKDFDKISDYLDRMIGILIGYSDNLIVIHSDGKSFGKISNKFVKDLDKKSRADFKEAVEASNFGLTTASFMLFCRVAETMANSYYEKHSKSHVSEVNFNSKVMQILI